jgi:hypothetical protein
VTANLISRTPELLSELPGTNKISWARLFLDVGFRREPAMHDERMAFEHYRIHVMELWPDGPTKEAGIASARYALESLARTVRNGSSFACTTCASRRQTMIVMPNAPPAHKLLSSLAA